MNFARRDPVGARTGGCEPGFVSIERVKSKGTKPRKLPFGYGIVFELKHSESKENHLAPLPP